MPGACLMKLAVQRIRMIMSDVQTCTVSCCFHAAHRISHDRQSRRKESPQAVRISMVS